MTCSNCAHDCIIIYENGYRWHWCQSCGWKVEYPYV